MSRYYNNVYNNVQWTDIVKIALFEVFQNSQIIILVLHTSSLWIIPLKLGSGAQLSSRGRSCHYSYFRGLCYSQWGYSLRQRGYSLETKLYGCQSSQIKVNIIIQPIIPFSWTDLTNFLLLFALMQNSGQQPPGR